MWKGPDFHCRFAVFPTLHEVRYVTLSTRDWLSILYDTLRFIQDPEDLITHNNTAFTPRHFVRVIASDSPSEGEAEPLLIRTVFPALKNALRSTTELVRAEALCVIAHAVLKCERIVSLEEMRPSLAGSNGGANFLTSIRPIQTYDRRKHFDGSANNARKGTCEVKCW